MKFFDTYTDIVGATFIGLLYFNVTYIVMDIHIFANFSNTESGADEFRADFVITTASRVSENFKYTTCNNAGITSEIATTLAINMI